MWTSGLPFHLHMKFLQFVVHIMTFIPFLGATVRECFEMFRCKFMHKFFTKSSVLPLVIKVPLKSLTNDVYASEFAYVKFVCTSVVLRLAQARSSLRSKASSFNWGI